MSASAAGMTRTRIYFFAKQDSRSDADAFFRFVADNSAAVVRHFLALWTPPR
jgi:hypothetical protein